MLVDQYNQLMLACQDAANYPANGIRTRLFRYTLEAYKPRVAERTSSLFKSRPRYPVDFLEAYDGEGFGKWEGRTEADLKQHLEINRKDPKCRHIFIQANTSTSPLDCSKDVFLLLLSFHHVMPQFLDLVLSFGRRNTPCDFHYTAFHHENFLSKQDAKDFEILKLGRSGRQIRQCYNLWSIEKSDADLSWSFRQTAVYHTFDVVECRALWINVKANDLMLDRISDVETMPDRFKPGIGKDNGSSFAATLTIHLVIFQWCCENWRHLLASLENDIRAIVTPVRNAPIAEVERALTVDLNALLSPSPVSPTSSGRAPNPRRAGTISTLSTGMVSVHPPRRVLSNLTVNSDASRTIPPALHTIPDDTSLDNQGELTASNRFRVLKEFSVQNLQQLGGIGSKVKTAAMVMKLDVKVISKIMAHYNSLLSDDDFPGELKTNCGADIARFNEQCGELISRLEMEQERIAALAQMIGDGQHLFDSILQYRNMEVNKLFAVNAQDTATRMEDMTAEMHQSTLKMEKLTSDMGRIAKKTERETASMHIITLVTLIFLPSTFVATLFGSGLFQWDQNKPEAPFPMWKQEYFNLFAEVSFPLMFVVVVIWYIFYQRSKRRGPQQKDDEEMQALHGEEKTVGTQA